MAKLTSAQALDGTRFEVGDEVRINHGVDSGWGPVINIEQDDDTTWVRVRGHLGQSFEVPLDQVTRTRNTGSEETA